MSSAMRAPPVLRSQITTGSFSFVCSSRAHRDPRARRAANLAMLHFLLELQVDMRERLEGRFGRHRREAERRGELEGATHQHLSGEHGNK